MEPEYRDKSIRLFISVMKIAMGILGVFSFCYIISAIGLINWEYYLPTPHPDPIVMDSKLKDEVKQEEITPNFKKEAEEQEDQDEKEEEFKMDEFLKDYNEKLESYLKKDGLYYELYKKNKDDMEDRKEEKNEKNDKYFEEDESDYDSWWFSYFKDDYGFIPNLDAARDKESGLYNFREMFPRNYSFNQ